MSEAVEVRARAIRSVLLVDPAPAYRDSLGQSLRRRGLDVWMTGDIEGALQVMETRAPQLVALELSLADGSWRDLVTRVPVDRRARLLILTTRGSIATAVVAIRMGLANYLMKPVTAEQLLRAGGGEVAGDDERSDGLPPLSLDRAIWELLCQAVETCGSIAGAARMLRVDRRSLRRMLQKTPPAL